MHNIQGLQKSTLFYAGLFLGLSLANGGPGLGCLAKTISAMVYRIEENVMRRRYHVMRLGNNFNRYLRISCMHIKGTAILSVNLV